MQVAFCRRGIKIADVATEGILKFTLFLVAGLAALSAVGMADQNDKPLHPWMVRVRALDLVPANNSGAFNFGGTAIPADAVHLSTKAFPEVDFSYAFSKNLSAELVLTYPQQHDVSIAGVGHIGTLTHLPPTLIGQYHYPIANTPYDPYVGLGLNFTMVTSSSLNAAGTPLDVTKTSLGLAYELGIDYKLNERWVVNLDFKHVNIHTNVKAAGAIVTNVDVNPNLYSIGIGYRF